jgi:hypothetical protein
MPTPLFPSYSNAGSLFSFLFSKLIPSYIANKRCSHDSYALGDISTAISPMTGISEKHAKVFFKTSRKSRKTGNTASSSLLLKVVFFNHLLQLFSQKSPGHRPAVADGPMSMLRLRMVREKQDIHINIKIFFAGALC